jgi:hypothetical protein
MRDFIAGCFLATGVTSRISFKEILEGGELKKGEPMPNMLKTTITPLYGL